MPRRRLLWQIFPSHLALVLLAMAAVGWHAATTFRRFHIEQVKDGLLARARLLDGQVLPLMDRRQTEELDAFCKRIRASADTRITVILPYGEVVADSDETPQRMENHRTPGRPEVLAALSGKVGRATRFSATLRMEMVYVAVPLYREGEIVGALRMALPLNRLEEALRSVRWKLAAGGTALAALAAVLSWAVARRLSRPLVEMKRGAERFARGDLSHKLPVSDSDELGGLAEAMNHMAEELDERIRAMSLQRNEREAILSSMAEGILAVDAGGRVISLNHAASEMLGTTPDQAVGRTIEEVLRAPELRDTITRVLEAGDTAEVEFHPGGDGGRDLHARAALLRGESGRRGVVVVLNDITRLRRLEKVRQDFVANVSHELRTPITSIKGFVETLLDGAYQDPDRARRFLEIVLRQADRLNVIIQDLLLLSRIENAAEANAVSRSESSIREIVQNAVETCGLRAEEKKMSVRVECEEGIRAVVNAPLLEEALINLIDNAVKYSDAGGQIQVRAAQSPVETVLSVADQGPGISREHLPRLFERFYRVDRGRSREIGGTGLGLAIVKHIAQAHGGTVAVESVPGEGSVFSIRLPR